MSSTFKFGAGSQVVGIFELLWAEGGRFPGWENGRILELLGRTAVIGAACSRVPGSGRCLASGDLASRDEPGEAMVRLRLHLPV